MSDLKGCNHGQLAPNFCSICEFRNKSICSELGEHEMAIVSKTMAHHPVKEGKTLIEAGEISEFLYLVISGTFRLVRHMADGRRQVTGFVFPGDFIGMSGNRENVHSAEALEPSLVCSFSHNYLDDASSRHPEIKDRLIARGDTDLLKAQDHIMLLGKQTAEERVVSFLTMLATKQKLSRGEERQLFLAMPRQDIADYLGLRLETLSRTLANLKKSGKLVAVSGRYVELSESFELA